MSFPRIWFTVLPTNSPSLREPENRGIAPDEGNIIHQLTPRGCTSCTLLLHTPMIAPQIKEACWGHSYFPGAHNHVGTQRDSPGLRVMAPHPLGGQAFDKRKHNAPTIHLHLCQHLLTLIVTMASLRFFTLSPLFQMHVLSTCFQVSDQSA